MVVTITMSKPIKAVLKCYKDVCVGQTVKVIDCLYVGNQAIVIDILAEKVSDDDYEQVRDYYKYFGSFKDWSVNYLYRFELEPMEE